jgi:hypothetical protein
MMFRSLASIALASLIVALAASACGDDDTTNTTTTTTGAEPDAAGGDIDASDAAAQFCADYETICGYNNTFGGDPYADLADCEARFNGYTASRQSCVVTHLGFAAGGMASLHCTHAEGLDPCD